MGNEEAIKLAQGLIKDHQQEILYFVSKYGDDAWNMIWNMFSNKGLADTEFNLMLQDKSVNELMDIAIDEAKAGQDYQEKATAFLADVGKGAGIILKFALKSFLPIP